MPMRFSEIVAEASALLQRKGCMTYRALQRKFELDDEALEIINAGAGAHWHPHGAGGHQRDWQ